PLIPVAPLAERLRAALLDAFFLLSSYAGFLGLFISLGGQVSFGKYDALVYGAAFLLFYAQYFSLFTVFGGSTPGMHFRGLHVVSFDGTGASARQLLWRSFGYLLSAGTLFLGFLWALWDEDHLTWQDRISQTYITCASVLHGDALSGQPAVLAAGPHVPGRD
ncbi:MAG: RDD family protein, partial [bacterium]